MSSPGVLTTPRRRRVPGALALAVHLVTDEDVAQPGESSLILARVAGVSIDELHGSSAAILMADPNGLTSMVLATDDRARQTAALAFTLGEGPCLDALRDYEAILLADLDHPAVEARWPVWVGMATDLGVHSVAAFPIRAGAIAAGVLLVVSTRVNHYDATASARGQRIADTAFLGLLDLRAGLDGSSRAGDELAPTVLRTDVHRAAGMVMAQAGTPIDDALARLRAFAFSSDRAIDDVARDVVAGRLRFDTDDDGAE